MTELPEVTLVCADCAYHDQAADAIRRSMAQCRFGRALFFTDRDFAIEGVETVRIAPLRSMDEYSEFMLKRLVDHVRTSHALVIQWDGFVLDGGAWRGEFLRYDYIGAVWPNETDGHDVGNGGFSLRSRRLLEALRDPDIRNDDAEDRVICRGRRPLLEARHAIRFATPEVARRFSFEFEAPQGETFGFHAIYNFGHLFGDDAALLARVSQLPERGFAKADTALLIDRLRAQGRTAPAETLRARLKAAAQPRLGSLLDEALQRFDAGDLRGASRACADAIAIDETDGRALHLLGLVFASAGRADDAIKLVRLALRHDARTAVYHSTLGSLLVSGGQVRDGIASLRAAVDLDPGDPYARRHLADALQRPAP